MTAIQIGRRTALARLACGIGATQLPWPARAESRQVVTAKFALRDNQLLVPVRLNGGGPYTFMIDTGGYLNLIRPELARELKLAVHGIERSTGIAGRARGFTTYVARDVVIGDAFRQPTIVLQDSFDFASHPHVSGALAAGMLTSFDTDLDFDAGELRIYPDGRGERTGFAALDATIPQANRPDRGSRKIVARMLLDGRPLRCAVDTGSPRTLLVSRSAAMRLGLWRDDRPFAPFQSNGIGGRGTVGRIVRAQSLALGGLAADAAAERPLVGLLGDDVAGDVDAIVGLPFIRRVNLSIDAARGRLWGAPSRQPPVADRYALSGLWLDRAAGGAPGGRPRPPPPPPPPATWRSSRRAAPPPPPGCARAMR